MNQSGQWSKDKDFVAQCADTDNTKPRLCVRVNKCEGDRGGVVYSYEIGLIRPDDSFFKRHFGTYFRSHNGQAQFQNPMDKDVLCALISQAEDYIAERKQYELEVYLAERERRAEQRNRTPNAPPGLKELAKRDAAAKG